MAKHHPLLTSKAHHEKHVTIQELNEELRKMSIGQNDRTNKPVPFSESLLHGSSVVGSGVYSDFLS